MNLKIEETLIKGVLIVKPKLFHDERGFFLESFNQRDFNKALGKKEIKFVQDNHSRSSKGVIRGLHYQTENSQGKLVRVTRGEIFDVVVDLRIKSKTFGKSFSLSLSETNNFQLWIPEGFAHGFQVVSEYADVLYKTTDYWNNKYERTLIWNDPDISIKWPIKNPKVSSKDKNGKFLSELVTNNELN